MHTVPLTVVFSILWFRAIVSPLCHDILKKCLMNVFKNWHSGVSIHSEGHVLESLVLLN